MIRLILASRSPRRSEILRALGLTFETLATGLEETTRPDEAPEAAVERLARAKARAAVSALLAGPPLSTVERATGRSNTARRREVAPASPDVRPSRLVLGADTAVAVDAQLFGKPAGPGDAESMLERLSGRAHQVVTGLALMDPDTSRIESGARLTTVWFSTLSRKEIVDYVTTGEPMDKAGAYGIQERGGWFVEKIEGSYTNVVGLPVELFRMLVGRFGLSPGDLSSSEPI